MELLRSRFPHVTFRVARSEEELRALLPEAHVLYAWRSPADLTALAPRLRWLHAGTAGVGGTLHTGMLDHPAILTNSSGVNSVAVAEHALACLLALARGLHVCMRLQAEGRWGGDPIGLDYPVVEVGGKTVGIVGYGSIGMALAERCRALGMEVLALRRSAEPARRKGRIWPRERLPHLLQASDFVVLTVPLTPETEGMIGEPELRLMRPSAYLINVARGRLVAQEALIQALREGWIGGAALDVFREEPLPPGHPFYSLPNVLVTPHMAGMTPRFWEKALDLFSENLRRFLAGEPLLNLVDKDRGY